MLDIDVVTRAMRYVSATGTPQAAEADCAAIPDPFSGVELAAHAIGAPRTLATDELLRRYAAPIPLGDALRRRGALLLNGAGRVAVVVADGKVVTPAGRRYALTPTNAEFWLSGWWPSATAATMGTP